MIIKRFYENGNTDVVQVKDIAAAKKQLNAKNSKIIAIAIIEAITEIILAILIRKDFFSPLKEKGV